ncbi:WD40/YVTN/BNR-like repeat-containing protein [Thalassotalea litorea]|uniref:WD40/YVTN/BNR-like repeat-containing protein n=1 Tax=Thalassotalea litorea TaxID=2020715 RepID=UPI003735336D
MLRTILILFSMLAYSALSAAQANSLNQSESSQFSQILPLASQSLMLDVSKVSEQKLIAVGERGHILTSTDGTNWQQKTVPTISTLTRVFFLNEDLGWAVGHDSVILKTEDGGESWAVQMYEPDLERPLFDVLFTSPKQGVAVGAYGRFLRTQDGGATWTEEFHDELLIEDDQLYLQELKEEDEELYLDEIRSILPHFNRIKVVGEQWYLIGELGFMAKSDNRGRHWQLLDEIYQGSFFDINVTSQQRLIVAGLRGNLFTSEDMGEDWQQIPLNTKALLNAVILAPNDTVYVLANSGVMLTSKDQGKTFNKSTQPDGKAIIAGVWFNDQLILATEVGLKAVQGQ